MLFTFLSWFLDLSCSVAFLDYFQLSTRKDFTGVYSFLALNCLYYVYAASVSWQNTNCFSVCNLPWLRCSLQSYGFLYVDSPDSPGIFSPLWSRSQWVTQPVFVYPHILGCRTDDTCSGLLIPKTSLNPFHNHFGQSGGVQCVRQKLGHLFPSETAPGPWNDPEQVEHCWKAVPCACSPRVGVFVGKVERGRFFCFVSEWEKYWSCKEHRERRVRGGRMEGLQHCNFPRAGISEQYLTGAIDCAILKTNRWKWVFLLLIWPSPQEQC